MKFEGNGVLFRGESASNSQKITAPPKQNIFDFMLTFCAEHCITEIFWRRKIKCLESSETTECEKNINKLNVARKEHSGSFQSQRRRQRQNFTRIFSSKTPVLA